MFWEEREKLTRTSEEDEGPELGLIFFDLDFWARNRLAR